MSKDHYVDLSVIAEFKMIKQLTSDVDLILKSIKDSDKVKAPGLHSFTVRRMMILLSGGY